MTIDSAPYIGSASGQLPPRRAGENLLAELGRDATRRLRYAPRDSCSSVNLKRGGAIPAVVAKGVLSAELGTLGSRGDSFPLAHGRGHQAARAGARDPGDGLRARDI
jgi:hypothetical protein